MPEGFDFGGIVASESIEGGEGDPLVRIQGANDLGASLGVKGIQTRFGFVLRGQGAVPVDELSGGFCFGVL